jgi:hypothetical protein
MVFRMLGKTRLQPYRVDTLYIPEGVTEQLASERNSLIESFRSGERNPEDVHFDLLQLY